MFTLDPQKVLDVVTKHDSLLSQATPADACSQLPTIMDLMAPNCASGEKSAQITAGDLAFLRATYQADLETPLEIEQSNIQFVMLRELEKNNSR